jgi:vitamin B12 transporter
MYLILLAAAAAGVAPAASPDESIIVTGAREPEVQADTPVSSTLFDATTIEALGLPMAQDVLRLSPGLSVASTGPRGSQTQVRIRGAEANHTLLFVDGIRFNDPAAGNEARFELLTSNTLSRIEVVRGPQSALWGSEALGGVIAVDSAGGSAGGNRATLLGEYGSLDSRRAAGEFAVTSGALQLSGSAGWLGSDGIDSFGRGGERDGFNNRSASLKAVVTPLPQLELGLVGHWVEGRSEYDGSDPVTFQRAETLDVTRNRIGAVRGWGATESGGWKISADASWLGSVNRNLLAGNPLNRTSGERLTAGAQVSKSLGGHRLTAAVEHENEDFHARDQSYSGGTDQDRSRHLNAFIGEWRADWSSAFSTDLAVRHDGFSAFSDATTLRASAILRPTESLRLHAAYGEGIAQPTFYDLFGFFPGSFQGNSALKPEQSRGWEVGLRWSQGAFGLGATGFSNRLKDEIVDTFNSTTFLSSTANATGRSQRKGLELEAKFQPSQAVSLTANYTYLDADEQQVAGNAQVHEVRRPRHTANLIANGSAGRLDWSASLAYVGRRTDKDFDLFPAPTVLLHDYLLGSARIAWKLVHNVEVYARSENLFDARYRDVVGYNMPGRTVYAGVRLRLGD